MPELSRVQIAVYAAVAVAILLIGSRAIRDGGAQASSGDFGFEDGGGSSLSISAAGGKDVVVHVAGAVAEPGVYRLPAGARVTDAVQRAGGGTASALLDSVNLAARVADGQQIVVPESGPAGVAAVPGAPEAPISLGMATVEQLDTVEGIGPVTAQDIVEFRDEHGGLSSIEQLDEISGVGPATMEALRDGLQP